MGLTMDNTTQTKADWIRTALERYEQPLLRYAVRITGDVERARDIVQDTFMRLCEADRAKVDGRMAAWLYTVCRNRAFDVVKKEGRMEALEPSRAEAAANGKPGPRAVAERHEAHGLVVETVKALPDKQQEAFRLKFEDELTYREISQVMGVSLGKVSNLIAGALETLRQRLRGEVDLVQEAR